MPELPEVEMARQVIERRLAGRVVSRVRAPASRVVRKVSRARLRSRLRDARLEHARRHGKVLMLAFSGQVGVVSHLGMSGKWLAWSPGEALPSHVRLALELDDGSRLFYRDPRMFGWVELCTEDELAGAVAGLGPDPLNDGLDPQDLHQRLRRTRRAVKVALMDQKVVAGIGNIQATEALFRARVHPAWPALQLQHRQVARIVEAVEITIERTLEDLKRRGLRYQSEKDATNPFVVYGRAGEPCPECGRRLREMTLGGRTTVYCTRCQRSPRGSERTRR